MNAIRPQAAGGGAPSAEDRARADFYALVARLLSAAPDAGLLAALGAADELPGEGGAALPRAWEALRRAALDADEVALQDEFDRLLVGVGKPAVMAYGSYYLAGFLMEKPLAVLRDDLRRLGFSRRAGVAESEDHLAALAEVMRMLILEEEGDADEAARFFARHVEPWYGRFTDALEATTEADFYRQAARFVRAFLDVEKESFSIEA